MSKPKTQEQLDRATDKRLKKTYGVGLDWYNKTLEEQSGCAVCGDHGKTRRLNIDHSHAWTKIKITSFKKDGMWIAQAPGRGGVLTAVYRLKREAVQGVRNRLRIESIRGLLCHRCNRAMILLRDNPNLMRTAANYLEAHQGVKT